MRIISGKYKGRVIKMPKGIRPTQNKVRKALFDILGGMEGLSFLDLFSGSGAIGFEAISRGAAGLVLVEYDRDCLAAIKQNIESLKLESCNLYPYDALKAIESLCRNGKRFDIIFLDPPYRQETLKKALQTLAAYDILSPNGFMVAQHFKRDDLPDNLGDLTLFRQAKYGDTVLAFYRKKDVPKSNIPRNL